MSVWADYNSFRTSEISVEEKERVETWMMFKGIKVNL